MITQTLPAPTIDLRTYAREYRSHHHGFHQIVLPMTGVLELETPRGDRRVDAGTGVVIRAGDRHAFAGQGANRFVVVDIAADHDAPLFERSGREPAVPVGPAVQHHLTFAVERLMQTPLSEHFRRHWTALLIEALDTPDRTPDGTDALFARATGWIERHLATDLHTRDVAAAVGLSPARLRTLFREQAGCTPREWIAAARLDRGLRQLAKTDRPIAEIALACGFGDQSAFTRAFACVHGEPPARWRRRQRRSSNE